MRIVTYNIHKGIGGRDRLYRLPRIIGVLEELSPDVICLQEVDQNVARSRYDDQPKLLADWFEADGHVFQRNVPLKSGGYGNLILSRFPIETKRQISLRMHSKKPRGAQMVVLNTPEGPLHLTNFHLGLAERERHWQVEHLLDHHWFNEAGSLPTLLVGDYNDWRNTLKDRAFSNHGFEQVTSPPSRYRSFPAYLPIGSLDKAFVRGAVGVARSFVAHSALSRRASDHLPLVLDVHLRSPEQILGATPANGATR